MESIRDLARMRSDRKGAGQLLREGRFAEAEEAFSAYVAARPRDATSLLGLGYVALLRNDLAAAETRLRAALDLKPRLKAARALLGELFYRRDDFGQAAPFFDAVGRAAMARKLASFAGQQPNEIDGASSITLIPFVRTDPLPVIELCVDGSGPARFLIDTGGGELILDRELANSVAAARFGAERSYFGGGKKAAFEHARVDSVVLGDLVMRNVPVIVMDLKELGPVVAEERLDGIVGTVPLYHFRSTIDYPSGRLVLERRVEGRPSHGPDATTEGKVALPFWLAGDHLMVAWGAVNGGRQTLLFVDTGLAGAGFTCPTSTLREARIEIQEELAGEGVGGGGTLRCVPFVVDELRLGDLRQRRIDGVAGAFPPKLEWELGFRLGGLISHQFFHSHALTLDFSAMQLEMQAPPEPEYG